MRLPPRDCRLAADPNLAVSSEGPIRGVRQTMPKLRMDSNLLARLGGEAFFLSEKITSGG